MRKSAFIIVFLIVQIFLLFFSEDGYSQQFYFPHAFFNDTSSLTKALPQLARQVSDIYYPPDKIIKEAEKGDFYDSAFRYEMVAGNYKRSIALIDSSRKYSEDGFGQQNIEFESYAYAKDKSKTDNSPFNGLYAEGLKHLYDNLSFNKKLSMDYIFDTAYIKDVSRDFYNITNELKNKNSDSISFKDAQSIVNAYNSYNVYRTVMPLAMPFVAKQPVNVMHPLIKNKWTGVLPVKNIDEIPNPSLKYNLLMEITSGIKNKKDSNNINNMNGAFAEVGRLLNLHIAAGIPKKNIHVVAVVHAAALYYLLNNTTYKKKYGIDNPNMPILKELQDAGVKIIACGQAMHFFSVEKEDMIPGVKISLTAQTVLSSYQLQNYVYYDLGEH
jgi:intracellular sulfur oxidation DsrE/DsrF family protein